ncbi:hypothetical protein J6590_011715 [Homalodisca vitripennis]|nr:hypothetical protein J6590_011715 [Homalodisca vitripennis]
MAGQADCLQGQDRSAVTYPSSSDALRCLIRGRISDLEEAAELLIQQLMRALKSSRGGSSEGRSADPQSRVEVIVYWPDLLCNLSIIHEKGPRHNTHNALRAQDLMVYRVIYGNPACRAAISTSLYTTPVHSAVPFVTPAPAAGENYRLTNPLR